MIKVTNLSKVFGDKYLFKNVSFEIESGERVALVGPSGIGKSTLLRCIAGLEKFSSGSIAASGKVTLVFQDFQLFPHLSVLENILYVPLNVLKKKSYYNYSLDAFAWLRKLGIDSLATKYPGSLSGGQQQRVSLIRAILAEPAILVMDEPTSLLDPQTTELIASALKDLSITYFFATHDNLFLDQFATRVIDFEEINLLDK